MYDHSRTEEPPMKLLETLIYSALSLLCFDVFIKQLCKLSPTFRKWWKQI